MKWLAKLILAFVGMYGVAAFTLALGWAESDGPAWWIAGAVLGGVVAAAFLVGWPRGWTRAYRKRAEGEARHGRVYYPAGAIAASVLIYLGLQAGGEATAFMGAASGAFLGVFAVWFTIYVPRHWSEVRARLGGPPT
jgi:hypothetical protein